VTQVQPEVLYVIVAVLLGLCLLLGGVIVVYAGVMLMRRHRDGQFGNPDRWVLNEVKARVTRQRREAAVDAFAEELKPTEVLADDE